MCTGMFFSFRSCSPDHHPLNANCVSGPSWPSWCQLSPHFSDGRQFWVDLRRPVFAWMLGCRAWRSANSWSAAWPGLPMQPRNLSFLGGVSLLFSKVPVSLVSRIFRSSIYLLFIIERQSHTPGHCKKNRSLPTCKHLSSLYSRDSLPPV